MSVCSSFRTFIVISEASKRHFRWKSDLSLDYAQKSCVARAGSSQSRVEGADQEHYGCLPITSPLEIEA
jgi:hypothetical protein